MARPYWSGRIQISLVSFGVSLYVATEAKSQISFHQISRSTGERVRHQKVLQSSVDSPSDDGATSVGKDDIVKGYEYSKGQYVTIEPSELDNLRVPSKHVIDVTQFIKCDELDPEYIEKPYFVVPENEAQAEAFATVRKALEESGKIAIGKIAFSGREHVVAIAPAGTDESLGMMAYTLRYENELRKSSDYFLHGKSVEVNAESLELAEALIAKKTSKFDLGRFEDGYEVAVRELVEAKVNNAPIPRDEAPAPSRGKVVNLMDALRKSIGEKQPGAKSDIQPRKKQPKSVPATKPGIALVKGSASKAPKRKSA